MDSEAELLQFLISIGILIAFIDFKFLEFMTNLRI